METASSISRDERPEGGQQQSKRRRIHTACKACQDRKTRCDGGRPACSTCTRRGLAAECHYDIAAIPPPQGPPSSIAALEERLGRLEQTRPLLGPPADIATQPLQQSPAYGHLSDGSSGGYGSGLVESSRPSIAFPTPSTRGSGQAEVDGLATVSSIDDSDTLYGASSTIALARFCQVKATGDDSPEATSTGPPRPSEGPFPEAIRDRDESVALYPPRQRADDYVRCFTNFVHPLFPILHEPSFIRQYERLWAGHSDEDGRQDPADLLHEAIFSSTLNIILALGCQFSPLVPAQNRSSMAQDFYQRSRRIYNYEVLDSMSLPLVQMLLLTGVYLQSAQNANRCWNVVGLAIRAAQGLGLHVETARSKGLCQVDREMRRRIWHCCLVLDRLLSMTFGRPVMISTKWSVPLPSLIDDEHLQTQGEGVQPNVPSRLGLLAYSSRLFLILEDILSNFYSSHPDFNVTEVAEDEVHADKILSDVISLNRRLDSFLAEVPAYLRYVGPPMQNMSAYPNQSLEIQRQVLHCRFLYIRVLLLRPVVHLATKYPGRFLSQAAAQGEDTTDDHLVKLFCNLCFHTATDLVHSIHQNLASPYRSSAWHSIYFTFGAAVVLLCAQICPAISNDVIDASFGNSWAESLAILEHYRVQLPVARQSIQTLNALKESLGRYLAERAPLPPPDSQLTMLLDLPQFSLPGMGPGRDGWFDLDLADFWGPQ